MNEEEKITVWVNYNSWDGLYGVSENPDRYPDSVQMTKHQFNTIKTALQKRYYAEQFIMQLLGKKRQFSGGTELEPDVDNVFLFGKEYD
jgi:hypothetical protein